MLKFLSGFVVSSVGLKQMLFVGVGGFLGSIARYKLGGFVLHRSAAWDFPLSTFMVNLVGCFAIGILAALVERRDLFSAATRLFLFTGFLGGFTIFSAFAYEGLFLIRRGSLGVAALYAGLSIGFGIAAVWIGMKFMGLLWRAHH